jgi:hypothetical protein
MSLIWNRTRPLFITGMFLSSVGCFLADG